QNAGQYTVRLIVTDEAGAADTLEKPIRVNARPTADFTFAPEEPNVGQTITFDASASSDPDDDPLTYNWDFGDGTSDEGAVVHKTYDAAGQYQVQLVVRDELGAEDTLTRTIFVTAPSEARCAEGGS